MPIALSPSLSLSLALALALALRVLRSNQNIMVFPAVSAQSMRICCGKMLLLVRHLLLLILVLFVECPLRLLVVDSATFDMSV